MGSKVAKRERVTVPVAKDCIEIRGARQNNLKAINVDLPLGKLTVVTGPSGSGKSSLAFETIYAEGQRRYVEIFSPYMRQFLDRMDKPRVDDIRGIPPAIAIEQSNPVKSSRSTVGTMTEINDYLKLLWPRVARAICPSCRREIRLETPKSIADQTLREFAGRNVLITFWIPVPPRPDRAISSIFFSSKVICGCGSTTKLCASMPSQKSSGWRARTGYSGPHRDQRGKSRASGRSHRNRRFVSEKAKSMSFRPRRTSNAAKSKAIGNSQSAIKELHSPPVGIAPIAISTFVPQVPGYSALTIHSVRVPNAADSAAPLRSI